MGNIRDYDNFEDLWFSDHAHKVRGLVRTCPKNCWMVGTAAPVMKKYIQHPVKWVVKNKIKSLMGKPICIDTMPVCDVGHDPLQGDLRLPNGHVNPVSLDPEYKLSEKEEAEILADIG